MTQKIYQWTVKCSRESVLGRAEIGGEGLLDEVKANLDGYLTDLMVRYPDYRVHLGQVRASLGRTNGYYWYRSTSIPLSFGAVVISMTLELKDNIKQVPEIPGGQSPAVIRRRVGRLERSLVTERLLAAFEAEALDEQEFDRRSELVLASVYADELPLLTADLPESPAAVPVVPTGGEALIGMTRDQGKALALIMVIAIGLIVAGILSPLGANYLILGTAILALLIPAARLSRMSNGKGK
jgi:uncharacterized protein DUF1707